MKLISHSKRINCDLFQGKRQIIIVHSKCQKNKSNINIHYNPPRRKQLNYEAPHLGSDFLPLRRSVGVGCGCHARRYEIELRRTWLSGRISTRNWFLLLFVAVVACCLCFLLFAFWSSSFDSGLVCERTRDSGLKNLSKSFVIFFYPP